MKNKIAYILNVFLIAAIILILIGKVSQSQHSISDSKIKAQITALNMKINELSSKVSKIDLNVNKSLGNIFKRVWQCEDNVKLQNEFMRLQFDKWQDYYLKHHKE